MNMNENNFMNDNEIILSINKNKDISEKKR